MVVPSSWTIRLTSSLLAGSALSITRDPRKLWRQPLYPVKGARSGSIETLTAAGEGAHDVGELRRLHRLGQVHLVTRGKHSRRVVPGGETGEGGRGHLAAALGAERAHLPDERVAVLAGHADVAHEHVGLLPLERGHGFAHRGEGGHVGAVLPEGHAQE